MRTRHAVAPRPGRRLRRWQRMRARLGLFAVWIAIAFWSMGASFDPPPAEAATAADVRRDADLAVPLDTDIAAEGMLAPSIDTEGALAVGEGSDMAARTRAIALRDAAPGYAAAP